MRRKICFIIVCCLMMICMGCERKQDVGESTSQKTEVKEEKQESKTETEEEKETYHISESEETLMYTTDVLNVRSGPNQSYDKKGTLPINSEIKVTGRCEETGWYQILYENEIGYVSNEYVSEEKIEIEEKTEKKKEVQQPQTGGDWVQNLNMAQNTNQLIIVEASGSSAKVSMHNKNADGTWSELLSTSAAIGRNGIGKTAEGDGKTPQGVYGFTFAFGLQPNPGTAMSYRQVDESYFWVDDSNSAYYNQLVSTNEVNCDWGSAEHIAGIGSPYNYVLAINYNSSCVPGKGSAIFLHCKSGASTAGCIAVPQSVMIQILQNLQPGCAIIIDTANGVRNY